MTEWRSFVEMLTDCAESLPLVTRISRGKNVYGTSEGGAMLHFSSVAVPFAGEPAEKVLKFAAREVKEGERVGMAGDTWSRHRREPI